MSEPGEVGEFGDVVEAVEHDGFAVVPDVIGERAISLLLSALNKAEHAADARRRGSVYAVRNLLDAVPEACEVIRASRVRPLVEGVLGASCFVVRSILFDKTPEANWKVAWHQDLSIAVRARLDAEGFGAWSEKAGVMHVQPPAEVLERMLSLRLHLDASDEANGPLRVIPGSHARGRLNAETRAELIAQAQKRGEAISCLVPRGGALLMKPLLLHASSASRRPQQHRRVVHLEFAAAELPAGLEWASRNASRVF
jgi:ectoine hydroxylase-related dioxygenase (phytanoyl-CoA dioxygenase family)